MIHPTTQQIKIACVSGRRTRCDMLHDRLLASSSTPSPDAGAARWRTSARVAWSRDGHDLPLLMRWIDSLAEIAGYDIRDGLDERADVPEDFAFLGGVEGVLFLVNPKKSLFPCTHLPLEMLSRALAATGTEPYNHVPIVFLVDYREAPPHERYSTDDVRLRISANICDYVDIDCETGEGLAEGVGRLLDLIGHTRSNEQPLKEYSLKQRALTERATPVSPGPLDPSLVLSCLDRGDHETALSLLLVAWRSCRAVELAHLVEAVSYEGRGMRSAQLDHAWWIETCRRRRLVELPLLLDTLLLWHDGVRLAEHPRQVVERLQGIGFWEDDPRITPRLGAMLADLTRYRRASVWRALLDLLVRHGDPRAVGFLLRLGADLRTVRGPLSFRDRTAGGEAGTAANSLLRRFPDGLPVRLDIPEAHRPAWDALVARATRALPRPEEIAAVAAAPTDDELRRDLAAQMRERGDPRGELIGLQFEKAQRELTPEEAERAQALVRTYAWDWLGPLADVADAETAVFEKGFPVELTVWTPNTRALCDATGAPEWATVRVIEWGGDPCWREEEPDRGLVEHPIMKSLERASCERTLSPDAFQRLSRVAWAR